MRRGTAAAALALVVAALAGCGKKEVTVPITFLVDADTCTTSTPEFISVTCASALGVWVRDFNDIIIKSSCVDFPTTADTTLADITPVLADKVDLSGIDDEPIYVEVGLFTPGMASDGCPDINSAGDNLVVFGCSPAQKPSQSDSGIFVTMDCYFDTTQTVCLDQCDTDYNDCEANPDAACNSQHDTCTAGCADDPCRAACDDDQAVCLADGSTAECGALRDTCNTNCAGDTTCMATCESNYNTCIVTDPCDGFYDQCTTACGAAAPAADTCISVL